jgi:hypothetical protein
MHPDLRRSDKPEAAEKAPAKRTRAAKPANGAAKA